MVLSSLEVPPVRIGQFCLRSSFTFQVPTDFNHGRVIESFPGDNLDGITDERYKGVSTRLTPGENYAGAIFSLESRLFPSDVLKFLKYSQNALLVGAQGLCAMRTVIPTDMWWIVSIDEPSRLWEDEKGVLWVPRMYRYCPESSCCKEYRLIRMRFDKPIPEDHCILCVYPPARL